MSEHTETTAAASAVDYATLPVAAWSIKDLTDVIGIARAAELVGTSYRNMCMLRMRGSASLERVQALQAEIERDEAAYRRTLISIRSGVAQRAR